MKLTRETVSEAIALGKDILPNFTALELAQVLNVPLIAVLKCIKANQKVFRLSETKTILGLDASSAIQTMNSNEVWNWYLKHRLGGEANRCLPLSDQNRLNASVNSRVKWEVNFGFVTATFASMEKSGTDVGNRVNTVYGADIATRLVRLGTVNGSGQIPDRYLFGVVVSEAEIAARKIGVISLYSPEWAMEEMLTEVDWTVIETGPKPGVQWIPKDEMTRGMSEIGMSADDIAREKEQDERAMGRMTESAIAASESMVEKPAETRIAADRKGGRRTKEQLDVERHRMNSHLIEIGIDPATAVQCLNIEKFKDAEDHYKSVLASVTKETVATSATVPISAPETGEQQELPGTAEARNAPPQPETPLTIQQPVLAHRRQSAMLTLASLEDVAGIKADIRAKANSASPQTIAPTTQPPIAEAIAQAPGLPLAPPPITPSIAPVTPVAAGGSASAEDLLNSLLKTTGQA